MNVFITGGSGFLGQMVIRKLIADGHNIGALARTDSSAIVVEKLGAKPIMGDITSVERFSNKLSEFDAVVHCAAPVEFWGQWAKYQQSIIDSTISLAYECAKQNVKRFIHISSESVLQNTSNLLDINEDFSYPDEPNSYYGKAKKITEEQLLKTTGKMDIIILRPSYIWGASSPSFTTITQKVKSGQFMWIDQGKNSFEAVHVENVAEAVRLSLTAGKNRSIYFVTDDENSSVREFFESLFKSLGLQTPTMSVPGGLLRPVASLVERIWKLLNIKEKPPISRFDLAFVAMPRRYNIDRIKTELGYRPIISRAMGFEQLHASLQAR